MATWRCYGNTEVCSVSREQLTPAMCRRALPYAFSPQQQQFVVNAGIRRHVTPSAGPREEEKDACAKSRPSVKQIEMRQKDPSAKCRHGAAGDIEATPTSASPPPPARTSIIREKVINSGRHLRAEKPASRSLARGLITCSCHLISVIIR